MKMIKEMQERLDSIRSTSAQACMQLLRDWDGEWGECISRLGSVARGQGALVQRVLKTASKYAENGELFTRIQVKRRIRYFKFLK